MHGDHPNGHEPAQHEASKHGPDGRGEVLFSARLTPHRSLGPAGFRAVMVFVATVCLTVGVVFWSMGLWPIMGFMGLDILALWWAIRMSYRSGRQHEDVEVSRQHLLVRQVSPAGHAREHWFNPFGTFFHVERHPEFGVRNLKLQNRNRVLSVGGFLNPDDKETFADAFGLALSRAKR